MDPSHEDNPQGTRKWGFVEGTINKQDDDKSIDLEDWWTVQSMIVSWIMNTIEPTMRSTVTYYDTAKELWDDLMERFSTMNGARIQ